MFKFNINNALRRIFRYKINSAINIFGLSISLAACIFILIWVLNEVNYDKFHHNLKNIYRINLRDKTYTEPHNYSSTPPPLAQEMLRDFPEIETAVAYGTAQKIPVKYEDVKINTAISFSSAGFFDIFTFPLISGAGNSLFSSPYSVIITQTIANKLFGDEDPLGKTVKVGNDKGFTITGIMRDIPHQSTMKFEMITSIEYLYEIAGYGEVDNWNEWSCQTYLLLPENRDKAQFAGKIVDYAATKAEYEWTPELYLQPFEQIHLYDINGGGPIIYVTIFSVVALFILLIACINFINLSTAQATFRAREIGIRKIIGASKKNLISQILTESFLLVSLSMLISFGIVELLYPVFTTFTGQMITQKELYSSYFIFILLGVYLLTGLISGLYPAFYLSVIKPVNSLKQHPRSRQSLFRKLLIIIQFTVSIFLIIASLVVYKQFRYLSHQELGFNDDQVLYIPLNQQIHEKFPSFKQEIKENPRIQYSSLTSEKIGLGRPGCFDLDEWEGNSGDQQILINILSVHYDFLEIFDIKMAQGQFFSEQNSSNNMGFVLNEAAVNVMGLKEPVGSRIFENSQILGVVKDFNYEPLHTEIKPLIIFFEPDWLSYIAVKISGEDLPATMKFIESKFNEFSPNAQFEYQFSDAAFDRLYHAEEQMMILFGIFSLVAIVLSSLGLFALSIFLTQSRLKEIGIRKVLGSSVQSILLLLSKDFVKWVLIAFLIAAPTACYLLNMWLNNYAYRISLDIWIFLLTGLISLSIALITVSLQTIKGAYANPADILKQE